MNGQKSFPRVWIINTDELVHISSDVLGEAEPVGGPQVGLGWGFPFRGGEVQGTIKRECTEGKGLNVL